MGELAPLETLPGTAGAIVDGLRQSDETLASLSLERLRDEIAICRDRIAFRYARFDWRFHIAREGDRVIFFFFRRDSPVFVVLDATVSFGLRVIDDATQRSPVDFVRWVPPPF